MGIFYAYVTGPGGEPSSKHVFAFASQDSSDKWWRALQASANKMIPQDQWSMLRVSAQCYVIEGPAAWSFHEQNLLSPMKGFIVQDMHFGAPEAPRILPPPTRGDYRNGKVYSIQLSGHSEFWNIDSAHPSSSLPNMPSIRTSKTRVGCTKFLIERTKALPGEEILIGSDEVTMTAIVSGKKEKGIAVDGPYLSQQSSTNTTLKFKFEAFFKGGFGFGSEGRIVWSSASLGDRWELVE